MDNNDQTVIDPNDLELIDPALEDEGKDDAALWNELEEAESGAAAPADDLSDQTPGDNAGGQDDGDDDAGAADGDDAAGTGDSAAAAGDAGKKPGGKQPSGDGQQTQDIWATAPPELKAAYEAAQEQVRKLEQAERSNRGRLSALQRQINELTAKPKAAPEQGAADGDQDGNIDDELRIVADEYPEVAKPFLKAITSLQAEITRQSKVLEAIGTERQQAALNEQDELLSQEHPDWRDLVEQNESDFTAWLDAQPRHIKEAAIRNAEGIVDAAEAADVISRFKAHLSQQQGGGNAQYRNNAPANNGRGDSNNRQQLSGKRKLQLEGASSARSRGPGAAQGIPEDADPQAIWDAFDKVEARKRA